MKNYSFVTLRNLPNPFMPQFLHLWNKDNQQHFLHRAAVKMNENNASQIRRTVYMSASYSNYLQNYSEEQSGKWPIMSEISKLFLQKM